MALVAYDNSDTSEYEDDDTETPVVIPLTKPGVPAVSDIVDEDIDEIVTNGVNSPSLFNQLPQPSAKKPVVIEEDDEFLHKKEKVDLVKPKAKITVPSLSDFKDVDSPAPVKPKAPSTKKSGLLSILPQPRNGFTTTTTTSKSLLPHVLQQKKNVKKPLGPPSAKKPKKLLNDYSDDSDNEEDIQNDFFSIHKPVEPILDVPLDVEDSVQEKAPAAPQRSKLESYFKPDLVENQIEMEPPPMEGDDQAELESEAGSSYSNTTTRETPSNGEIAIDQDALMKLVGARSKRHREDIQMVDVNQQDLLADSREWLLKGLMDDTSKRVSSSKRKGNEPTSQQKRKHQITYLAHQAKANEAELQNQWANSRMSRRQTQNKYGF